MSKVYVVVNFLSQVIFNVPKNKRKTKLPEIKKLTTT